MNIGICDLLLGTCILYVAYIIYSLRSNLDLRITEYEDGLFYIEVRSWLIPWLYHRRFEFDSGGNMTRDWAEFPQRGYKTAKEALDRINKYHAYIMRKLQKSSRKKIYKIVFQYDEA